jgi:hypothetical protein
LRCSRKSCCCITSCNLRTNHNRAARVGNHTPELGGGSLLCPSDGRLAQDEREADDIGTDVSQEKR